MTGHGFASLMLRIGGAVSATEGLVFIVGSATAAEGDSVQIPAAAASA